MNWEAIGAIAELVGGIGVIASLVYLATQIRQNTKWLRSTVLESAGTRSSEIARNAASDASLSRLMRASLSGTAPMDPDERYRFELYLLSAMRHYEISHSHFNDGLLNPDQFAGLRENLRVWLGYENFETGGMIRQSFSTLFFKNWSTNSKKIRGATGEPGTTSNKNQDLPLHCHLFQRWFYRTPYVRSKFC